MQLLDPTALWFLPFALPIGLWVAFSDLKTMRIPNKSVYALVAVFAVVGLAVLPLEIWAWRWAHLLVILIMGFVLNMAGVIGAGDAKFAAAMAPFVALSDVMMALMLLSLILIAALLTHRILRRIPAMRRIAPDWASWEARDFPMGLALGPTLVAYLAISGWAGA
ncbi:prepilin peptidase CpaA [Rhodovulum bhavnagarense]|uniref:Prepilin peptidase CpaA n=1 Tax=Rhodovulum bhavnagarense TaxID=992286 RepID=A0A4R2RH17_9RHOB|nr:prepilin peptidase [Rhodovulum bhavnagarense]TCP62263.1 prepilin peptidase CpaA [Rhodovulum bhavnagarense]